MKIIKEVREVLDGMKYQQHNKGMIAAILESYPSLEAQIETQKKNGLNCIELRYEHSLDKPEVRTQDDKIIIFINN